VAYDGALSLDRAVVLRDLEHLISFRYPGESETALAYT
jgi:hypothetical protein